MVAWTAAVEVPYTPAPAVDAEYVTVIDDPVPDDGDDVTFRAGPTHQDTDAPEGRSDTLYVAEAVFDVRVRVTADGHTIVASGESYVFHDTL
jgi:hypothetical protein